jgi:transcriptional regulator with XRE-family HTH domain
MNRTPLESAVFNDGRKRHEIAKAARLSASHFSQIMTGRRQPRISTALRLARVLNADVAELFNGNKPSQ